MVFCQRSCVVTRIVLMHGAAVATVLFALVAMPLAGSARGQYSIQLNQAAATADYHWESSPGGFQRQDTQADAIVLPEFSAFAAVNNLPGGRAAAYQDLYGINAVFAESQSALDDAFKYQATAESHYDIQVSTPTRESGQAVFKFVINGGELRLENFAAIRETVNDSTARVTATIDVFPFGTWSLHWTLQKFLGGPRIFDLSFDPNDIGLPTATPIIDGADAAVSIPRFEGEILIDREDFFRGVEFTYTMTSELDLNGLSIGGLAGIGDPFSLSMGGPSTNAVEFFLDGMPLDSFEVVPEPSGAVLFAAGASLALFLTALRLAKVRS